jgi:hypothetical protein
MDVYMNTDTVHLSSMLVCENLGYLKRGDTLSSVATYDFSKNPGMKNDEGVLGAVMNIALVFVIADEEPKMPALES